MTRAEKADCKSLLLVSYINETNDDTEEQAAVEDAVLKEIANKRRKSNTSEVRNYINFEFILGSVAMVERLLSHARKLLPDHRRNQFAYLSQSSTVFEG